MADEPKAYVEGVSGKAFSVTKEQAGQIDEGGFGAKGISEAQAVAQTQVAHDTALAEQHGGNLGAAVNRLSDLASFGLATKADIAMTKALQGQGAADLKRHVMAGAKHLPGGTVGELMGLYAGAKMIPIGEGVSGLLPEARGILGSAVKSGVATGVDGGFIGLGQAVSEAAIENKDLTAEAMLAHTKEGVLYGGGIGFLLGGAGAAFKGALSKGMGALASASGKDATGAAMAKELGANSKTMARLAEHEGGMGGFLEEVQTAARKEGTNLAELSRDPKKLSSLASKLESEATSATREIAKEIDSAASGGNAKAGNSYAPKWGTFYKQVEETFLAERAMAPGGLEEANRVIKWFETNAPPHGPSNFQNWVKGRDIIKFNALGEELGPKIQGMYDQYLADSMLAAEANIEGLQGASGRYKAAQVTRRTMQAAIEIADAKAAQEARPMVSPNDLTTAAMIGVGGGPGSAITYLGGKVGMRALAERFGPAMAEAMWNMSVGSKASGAVSNLKAAVKESVSDFFKASELGATKTAKAKFSRRDFDAELEGTFKAITKPSKDRFEQYVQETRSMALADAMTKVQERAAQKLLPLMPPAQYAKNTGKLRATPTAVGLSIAEHMFKKHQGVAKNPLSVLQDMSSGSLSKESVKTMKAIWPETHGLIVSEVKEQILKAQQSGKTLSMGKLTQLSIMLDEPLDPIMTKAFIDPVQMALNTPPAPVQPPQPQSPTETGAELSTPAQELL